MLRWVDFEDFQVKNLSVRVDRNTRPKLLT